MNLDALIEVLLANLPFILIVLGGLYSVFKRTTDENSKNKQEKSSKEVKPIEFDLEEMQQEQKDEKTFTSIAEQYSNYHSPENDSDLQIKGNEISDENINKKKKGNYYNKKQLKKMKSKVNNDKVIQGLIWSEILSEPRSKRPHSSKNKYKNVK